MSKDLFNEDNEVKSQFISWGKPGDYFVGTLMGTREVPNQLSDKNEMQTIYEFKMREGSFHTLDDKKNPVEPAVIINSGDIWSLGGKKSIDAQMRNVKPTTIVGMKFIEEQPPKTKGYNPTKVVKVYTQGEVDKEYVAELEAANNPIPADDNY